MRTSATAATDTALDLPRDPNAVQGGDLTHLPDGAITLNLSLCTNWLGPPPWKHSGPSSSTTPIS
ncbi:hypothetical protein JK364_51950 [Streptomyces sp. 110]|uniref:Uncharacterized protein n=1 Tax=Streptomyces endocoffeicus TaxID=2898945 RepID=A0ABS1Q8N4_9ACTN|nr:hypothetical protein [Streptomyces endocoffeicus]MBL1120720.1 hypothetical protein [Streptomyces endocoffeicus]